MRHPTRYFATAITVATTLALGLGSSVAAGTNARSTTASGSFKYQSDFFSKPSNGTSIEISQITYSGAVTGIAVSNGTATLQSSGSFSGKGTFYCASCTIAGKHGAFIATYKYSGSGNAYSATLTFSRGFSKLAGLKGGGSFRGNIATNSNTYTYHYTLL